MCGTTGFALTSRARGDAMGVLRSMTGALAHRGPDDEGVWLDAEAGIGLAHRRLSILDTSAAGRQPMSSRSGRYVLAFNGEIYNHLDLRADLGGDMAWVGHSDTETLVAAIEAWGLERALTRCVGMFALALWDGETRTLSLARDRFGEKPLYYGHAGDALVFGSELKALRRFPGFDATLDPAAAAAFLSRRFIEAPASIYAAVRKVRPGHILEVREGRVTGERPYWDLADLLAVRPFEGDPMEAAEETDRLLRRAIGRQLLSDVPLGAFLSGGVDSSLVTALMQSMSCRPVRTFCIGFEDESLNEAPQAAAVARILGVDHTELIMTDAEAADIVPTLTATWDEPFADASQIPSILLARLARRDVAVCLTGDGGDELFNGYHRHMVADALGRVRGKRLAGLALNLMPVGMLSDALRLAPHRTLRSLTPERLAGLREGLIQGSPIERYLHMLYRPRHSGALLRDMPPAQPLYRGVPIATPGSLAALSLVDVQGYLSDDILVKVDRATMAASLEARAPFLDHELAAFAFSLPDGVRRREGRSKWPLRELLARHAPRHLIDRRKGGFEAPIGRWLRGRLRGWAEALVHQSGKDQIIAQGRLQALWQDHLAGRDRSAILWPALIFRSWLDRYA